LKPQTVNIIKAKVRDMGHYSPGQTLKVRELVNHEINNEPWLKVVSGIAYLEPGRSVPIMVLNHTSKTIRLNKDSEVAEVIGGEVEIEEEDVRVAREQVNTMSYREQVQGYGRYKSDRARNFRPFLTRERREQMLEQIVAPEERKDRVKEFVLKNHEVFALHDTELGRTDTVVMDIDTGEAMPIHSRPYRTALRDRELVERALEDMLQAGVIRRGELGVVLPYCASHKKRWNTPILLRL
jgi:hypothetical protein